VYLRFIYARAVEGLQSREGIFQAATSLAWDPETDTYSYERVQNLRLWFGDKLEVDLSRYRAAPITHLCGLSFESQGTFPAEC
jgi:hypothetical protein